MRHCQILPTWISTDVLDSKRLPVLALLLVAVTLALLPSVAFAVDPPNQPFDLIFRTESPQKYAVAVEGLGMNPVDGDQTEGTLVAVDLGDTAIIKAYLVWAGLGTDPNGVFFARDAEVPVAVGPTPVLTWNNSNNNPLGEETWGCCGNELTVYAADISELGVVTTGVHSYTISGMSVSHGAEIENWGFSLIVVYADPELDSPRNIVIKLGNDGLWFNWSDQTLLGPNSDVQCIAVNPSEVNRTALFDFIVGGIKDDFRPNGLWGLTGSGSNVDPTVEGGTWTQEVGLINLPANPPSSPQFDGIGVEIDGPLDGDRTGNGIDWPFSDCRGREWDEYVLENVVLAAGREWVCVQIESANRPELVPGQGTFQLGASIGFIGFVAVVDEPVQGALEVEVEPNYRWTYTVRNPDDDVDLEGIRLVAGPHVAVTCPQTALAVGQSMQCTATSTDLAYYGSVAWVIGIPEGGGTAVLDFTSPDPLVPLP